MTLHLRKATGSDAGMLAAILTETAKYKIDAHDDIAWLDPITGSHHYSESEALDYVSKGDTYMVLLGDTVVGTICLQEQDTFIWGEQVEPALYIHRLAVKDSHRGQGLGSKIVDCAVQKAQEQGCRYLRLDFHPSNKSLAKYYKSLGFRYVGSRKIPDLQRPYTASLYERPV